MKKNLHAFLVILVFVVIPIACSTDDGGAGSCTRECGVVGLSTTFTAKTFLSTEENCRKMAAEETRGDCRYGYCPPTGNQDDCFEIK